MTSLPPVYRVYALTALAMVAFAANSVLNRLALQTTPLDAATFTALRLGSGALMLGLVALARHRPVFTAGSWPSAAALFVYAAAFSFAYTVLRAGTGALLLFGVVQLTMIGYGVWRGERFSGVQTLGLALALGGLVYLVSPGLSAPPFGPALLMALAGAAWGVYSLRGRGARDPVAVSAGNFVRTVPLAATLISLALLVPGTALRADSLGIFYAVLSGALTSGLGYLAWYAALPSLKATSAATVQLSVPVLAALGGALLLGEPVTLRLVLSSALILGGVALVLRAR